MTPDDTHRTLRGCFRTTHARVSGAGGSGCIYISSTLIEDSGLPDPIDLSRRTITGGEVAHAGVAVPACVAILSGRSTGLHGWRAVRQHRSWLVARSGAFATGCIRTLPSATTSRGTRRPRSTSIPSGPASAAISSILAITFCRAMNIPARYVAGYLGDIGVPPNALANGLQRLVRSLLARSLVGIRCPLQPAPYRTSASSPSEETRQTRLSRQPSEQQISAPSP